MIKSVSDMNRKFLITMFKIKVNRLNKRVLFIFLVKRSENVHATPLEQTPMVQTIMRFSVFHGAKLTNTLSRSNPDGTKDHAI